MGIAEQERVTSATITSSELKIYLSDIYRECERNIYNRNYIKDILGNLRQVKWNENVVVEYGGDIRDLIELIRHYEDGKFRNVSTNDIMFGLSLLIYYTEPTYISPVAPRATTTGVQVTVTDILMNRCREMVSTFRLYLVHIGEFASNGFTEDNNEESQPTANPREIARWKRETKDRGNEVTTHNDTDSSLSGSTWGDKIKTYENLEQDDKGGYEYGKDDEQLGNLEDVDKGGEETETDIYNLRTFL